jgi:hypothetical protein
MIVAAVQDLHQENGDTKGSSSLLMIKVNGPANPIHGVEIPPFNPSRIMDR